MNPTPAEIKAQREKAGLSQSKAAALVYMTKSGWQKCEYGDRAMREGTWMLFLFRTRYPSIWNNLM